MQSRRSPTRTRQSLVPALPPLVAPWQQEETIPNNTRPHPLTHPLHTNAPSSPSNEVSSSTSHHHPGSKREEEGANKTRLEKLELRVTILEQMNCALLEQMAARKTDQDGEEEMKEKLARMSPETNSRLEKLEHRVLLNEHSIRSEEARVTTLVKSTQEIEQGILDGQKQLLQRRDDHSACLEGLRESVHQLEQKQLQLGEFARQVHASFAMEARRLGEGVKKVKNHVENTRGSIGGKLKELECGHRALEERMLVVNGALQNTNVQMKKQMDSWVSGHSDLHRQLVEVEREKRKQDLQLRESFAQVQAQIQRHSSHLQEWIAGELRKSSENTVAENDRLEEDILSVLQYSQRECGKSRESLRTELETRITSIEELLESERKACVGRLEELHSTLRRECGETRAELTREITTLLQQEERGREVLQGTLSVMEKESKARRQELLAVVEAEIKTRNLEVSNLQSQYQKLSWECCVNTQTVRNRLEGMEERANTDREQLQSVRESLVSEWQAIAAQLLSDFDSRLSAVHLHIANLQRHPHPPPEKVTDVEQDTEDSRGDVNDSEKGHHDVVQWKEVLQQLSLVEKQQGDESQQIAGLNHALRELQVNLVGAIQRETNQRFHAVLELKNEMAQLAAGMPLFPRHMQGPPPDHDDSLDTSHVHSRQHMSVVLPQPNEQQLTVETHPQSCETTSVSGTSFLTEQGDGWREGEREGGTEGEREGRTEGERDGGREGERDGGREGEREGGREREREGGPEEERERREEEEDHHCPEPTTSPEQLHSTGGQNPLHSKSKIVLMSHHHRHHSDSTSRPTNATLELPDIAENEAELSPTPAQQPGHSQPGHELKSQSTTSVTGREKSDHEDILGGDGDDMSNSSRTVSVHERQYYSPVSASREPESRELEHACQELEREEEEGNKSPNVVWSIGEHN